MSRASVNIAPHDSAMMRAANAWGEPLPDWISRLAEACDAGSLRRAALMLKVSPALVSLALRNAHHAKLDYIKGRVENLLMVSIVACPILGMISESDCRHEQVQPFLSVNPLRVQLYRACRAGCPHSTIQGE